MPKYESFSVHDSHGNTPVIYTPESGEPVAISIYDVTPYQWDGHSRPNVDDYTAPWLHMASKTMYKFTATRARKNFNAQVTYAKNQLEQALAQYQADYDVWSEMDERNYTSQSAQKQRYEEAGFNLGYLYNQVDSGNSAVGYSNPDVSFEPNDNVGDNLGGVNMIVDTISSVASIALGAVSAGISIAKLPSVLMESGMRSALLAEQASWQKILRSVGPDGKSVDNAAQSIGFALQKVGLDISSENLVHLKEFTKHAAEIYSLQATHAGKEASQEIQSFIDDLNFDGENSKFLEMFTRLLGWLTVSKFY